MPIVNATNITRKVLPPVPAIAVLLLVDLLSQRGQAQNNTGGGVLGTLKRLGLGQFPRLGQDLFHAAQSLLTFLFLFGIGVMVVVMVVVMVLLLWSVRHDDDDE